MAALPVARRALDHARSQGETLFGMRPTAVGIVPGHSDDDFSLKVTLPAEPSRRNMPPQVDGVPVRYAVGQAALASSSPQWLLATREAADQSRRRQRSAED